MLSLMRKLRHVFLYAGLEKRYYILISESELFDNKWYLATYDDVAKSGIDPILHYLRYGAAEGRIASPYFDSVRYLADHADVRRSGLNPLVHFLLYGSKEGRQFHKLTQSSGLDATREQLPAPIVSVIIPIYDRVEELEQAIKSILNQTFQDFELILVTDGSPVSTMEVVDSYRFNPRVRVFSYPSSSGNAVRGRNKGILEARGEFVAFLDSDDIAYPDRLEKSVNFLRSSGADVVYGGWEALIDGSRNLPNLKNGQVVLSPDATLSDLEKQCVPCQSTVMVRKSVFGKSGPLKNSMEYREDHELWARLAYYGAVFKAIQQPLVKLRLHAGNNELNFLDTDADWFAKLQEEYRSPAPFPKKIIFIVPGVGINGGIAVIVRHAHMLMDQGHDVTLLNIGKPGKLETWFPDVKVPVIDYADADSYQLENIDLLFATGWQTASYISSIEAKRKLYFVQSDERRFADDAETKKLIEDTYRMDCEYLTEARWIQRFLKDEFDHPSYYVPNGLDLDIFNERAPLVPRSSRLKILIEGPVVIPFKGVADAYQAVKDLDADIWLVSSAGGPERDWRIDKFFEAVPFTKMHEIYSSCDVFIKMSRIEGFFGPPLEAMACGCSVVVSKVTGYDEYIVNEENALVVEMGDVEGAGKAVARLLQDPQLRARLVANGYETARAWGWDVSRDAMKTVLAGQGGETVASRQADRLA